MAYNEFEKDLIRLNRQLTEFEKRYDGFWGRFFNPLGYRSVLNQRKRYEELSSRCAAIYGTTWNTAEAEEVSAEGSVTDGFFTRFVRGIKSFFGFYQPHNLPSIDAMEQHILACEEAQSNGQPLPQWGKTADVPQAQAEKTLEREHVAEIEEDELEKEEAYSKEEPETVVKSQTEKIQSEAPPVEEPLFDFDPSTVTEDGTSPEQKEMAKKERKPLNLPPPPKENAWEFTTNKDVVGNEKIALTNDPAVLQEFLDEKKKADPDYNEYTVQALENRIEWLKYIENAEKTSKPSKPDPDVRENEEGELCINLDANQPLCQKSGNGCWSVSLQTQLNYRGIEIDQWHIRAHRPEKEKQSIEIDLTPLKLNSDSVNSISNYSSFVNKFLPNTVIHTVGYTSYSSGRPDPEVLEEREKMLREVIIKGLKEHNSPVSFVKKNHYCTIVGIEGDTILYKDPGSGRGRNKNDPNMTYTITISELAEASQLQLSWLQDFKVDLGGKVQDMNGYSAIGVDYSGGTYSDIGEEITDHNRNFTIHEASRDYTAKGGTTSFRMSSNYPATLGYKRNPGQASGFAYNMDALEQMSKELKLYSEEGKKQAKGKHSYGLVDQLSEKLDRFVSGEENIDYEQMYSIAKDYQQLLDKSVSKPGMLKRHLTQVRSALEAHLHYENRQLGYPKRWPEKTEADAAKREALENGLAGLIVASNIKEVPFDNANWLAGYDPNNFKAAKEQVRKSEAFESMMAGFDTAVKAETKTPVEERSYVRACLTACGGNPRLLLQAYHKNRVAQADQQDLNSSMHQKKSMEDELNTSNDSLNESLNESLNKSVDESFNASSTRSSFIG